MMRVLSGPAELGRCGTDACSCAQGIYDAPEGMNVQPEGIAVRPAPLS